MKSTRRSATVGAIGATLLLFAATACGSGSDDSGAEPAPGIEVATTVGDTESPSTESPSTGPPTNGSPGTEAPSDATTAPAADAAEPPAVVPEILAFTAPLVGGGTFDGAAVAGKPTVFWFWAPT